jgi:hypothetical protein
MALVFNGRGGGGSAFNGGTITSPLKIETDSGVALAVDNAAGTQTFVGVNTTAGDISLVANPTQARSALLLSTSALTFTDESGNVMLDVEGGFVSLGATGLVVVTPSNYLAFTNHTAIADAELDPGMCSLWFDQTNGAAKLMVKAKSTNGTVVTGSLALA